MSPDADKYFNYESDVNRLTRLYQDGISAKVLLNDILICFRKALSNTHKAHFLFMAAKVLNDIHEYETAYKYFLKTESLFPGTFFSCAAGDLSKFLFVQEKGRLRTRPTFVPTVQIEPTNYCNIDCIMCGRDKSRPPGHMNLELFKKIINQTLSAGAYAVRLFHMGEPLLNKQLGDFIVYFTQSAKEYNLGTPCFQRSIGIMTNGMLMKAHTAEELMQAGINAIGFSIDGRTSEEYERIRRGACHHLVIENLAKTRKLRDLYHYHTHITVSILDMELNTADRFRLNKYYLEHGADNVAFIPLALLDKRHVIDKDGNIIPAENAKTADAPRNRDFLIDNRKNSPAPNELDRLVVLWNGDIQATCGECSPDQVMGNIENLSLKQAFGIKMRNLGFQINHEIN